ncbi:hypothetical protein ACPCK9_26720 [Streptomyces koyangensis]|uniref:hypothetical protein n=1 Tax=Streptomyces koyangensis TaxID=188770 RepID=UPI003C2DD584
MGIFDVNPATQQTGPAPGLFTPAGMGEAATVVVKAPPGTTLASVPAPYSPRGSGALSDEERQDLEACKAGVDNLRNAFWVAGKSLETLKKAELHREENPNFAEWVWERWEISESQLHRLIAEWPVGEALHNLGHKPKESQVRKLTRLRAQTNDRVAIAVYDTIARCTTSVTGKLVEEVVDKLGTLAPDVPPAEVSSRVRQLMTQPEPNSTQGPPTGSADPQSHSATPGDPDSPIGESDRQPSPDKGAPLAQPDVERLEKTLDALKRAAGTIHKTAVRRAVDAQPEVAYSLVREIGAHLQKIDRAVAVRMPPEYREK